MGTWFWIRRFIVVGVAAFVVIGGAQWLQGEGMAYAAIHASIWAPVSAGIFTAARIHQSRRGRHCALCNDIPQAVSAPDGKA